MRSLRTSGEDRIKWSGISWEHRGRYWALVSERVGLKEHGKVHILSR